MDPRDELLLQDLLDDRLDDASAAQARERLAAEPALQETWDELCRIRDLIRGAPGERAPRDFLARVRADIAAVQASPMADQTPTEEAPAEGVRGRRPSLVPRLALAASGIAALLLVAVGVRLMVGPGARAPEDALVLESAKAPQPETRGHALDALHERAARSNVEGAPATPAAERSAPDEPSAHPAAPSSSHPAAPSSSRPARPRPARGGFAPGDQVQPNLRTPSDEVEDLERVRDARGSVRDTKGRCRPGEAPAAFTWTLEAVDLEVGRARLALIVGGLDDGILTTRTVAGARAGSARFALRPGREEDVVLGSVLLCLPADQVLTLDRRTEGRTTHLRLPAEGDGELPPGVPGDPESDEQTADEGKTARAKRKAEQKTESRPAEPGFSVRVLVVLPAER